MTRTARRAAVLLALAALSGGGCGGCDRRDDPAPALTADEKKRQAEELDRQRRDEWGKPKGK
jgi:hypothetical protein